MGVIITAKIEDVRDMCRAGQWRAYTKGRDIYLENCVTHESVWLNERDERQAAPEQKETPHGGRTARMFAGAPRPQQPKPEYHDDEGPYRGFLMVKCEACGKVRAFCAKIETYGFRCDECRETTPLEHLRPLFLKCGKCGAVFRYKTNITDKYITHTCVKCGAPVDMMLNTRETAYVTIGERKEFRRNGKD